MELSVVIPTRNRRSMLTKALNSLTGQAVELVVIDNGSSDGTRELIESRGLRYILETQPGASNAKNRGIHEAKGKWIAFLDDDATADPQWAKSVLRAIAVSPAASVIGGPIIVEWPGAKPAWMPREREGYYGHCDYGPVRRRLVYPEYPFGSNMVLRRDLLLSIGGLSAKVGPVAGNMMSAGEQEMFYRLSKTDAHVVYEPTAKVHHWIPAAHVKKRWLLRRAMKHGASNVRIYGSSVKLRHAITNMVMGGIATATATNERARISRAASTAYWFGVLRERLTAGMDDLEAARTNKALQAELSKAIDYEEKANNSVKS